MKKMCKTDKISLKKDSKFKHHSFKCKKCGLQSDCKKSLCKAKSI